MGGIVFSKKKHSQSFNKLGVYSVYGAEMLTIN